MHAPQCDEMAVEAWESAPPDPNLDWGVGDKLDLEELLPHPLEKLLAHFHRGASQRSNR